MVSFLQKKIVFFHICMYNGCFLWKLFIPITYIFFTYIVCPNAFRTKKSKFNVFRCQSFKLCFFLIFFYLFTNKENSAHVFFSLSIQKFVFSCALKKNIYIFFKPFSSVCQVVLREHHTNRKRLSIFCWFFSYYS